MIEEAGMALKAGQRLTAIEVAPHETYLVLATESATVERAP